jgi:hypothetical protein
VRAPGGAPAAAAENGDDRDQDYDYTVTAHGAAAKTLAALLTTLRATPKSQTRSRAVRRDQTPEVRPWEIRAERSPE